MTDLLKRKSKLQFKTPYTERGRNIIVEVKPWGLELREAGRRRRVEITWGSIWNRANILSAEKIRAERKAARAAKKAGAC